MPKYWPGWRPPEISRELRRTVENVSAAMMGLAMVAVLVSKLVAQHHSSHPNPNEPEKSGMLPSNPDDG
jgi:hypothetical protein